MKVIVRNAILFAIPAILIVLAYPVTTYFRNFDFPFLLTFFSYLIAYAFVLAICVGIGPTVARLSKTPLTIAVLQAVTAVLCFAILSFICGPIGVNLPHTRLRGIFFSEWKFVNFFFYVGLPMAFLSGAAALIKESRSI